MKQDMERRVQLTMKLKARFLKKKEQDRKAAAAADTSSM